MPKYVYYIIAVIAAIIVIGLIVFFFVQHKNAEPIFKHRAWKKLYALAQDQDFYLMNNVNVKTEESPLHISHLLLGEKYVYVISTRYFEDDIQGPSYVAQKWSVVDKEGKELRHISNPIMYNEQRTMILAKFLGWDPSKTPMFISIVIVNDSINYKVASENPKLSEYSFIVQKKDVVKLIKKIEKASKFASFDEENLQKIVDRVHRLSVNNNTIDEKNRQTIDKQKSLN